MTHTCLYLPTKTQISGREYRACPVCGATPAQAIILTAPDRADTHRPAPVCAGETDSSVRQGTEPCFFDVTGEADRKGGA